MEVQENGHRLLQNGTRQPAQELMNFDWVPTQRCTAADTKFWPLFNVGLDFITENNKNIYINGWNMIGDELKDDWESSAILQETCARSFARARNSLSSSVAALQVRREPVRGDLRLPGVGGGRGRPGDPGDADPVHRAPIKSAGALGTPALLARPSSHPAYLTATRHVQIDPAVPDKIFRYKYTCFESASTDDLMPMPACTTSPFAIRSCERRHTLAPQAPNLDRNVPAHRQQLHDGDDRVHRGREADRC